MSKQVYSLFAALSFLATAQGAEPPRLQALEQAIESSSSDIRLPERAPATFFARSCVTCPTKSLQVTRTTQFFLGKSAVAQNEFNQAVQQSAPTLGIFYDSKTSEVTRLVAFGITSQPATNPKSRRGK